MDGEEAAHEGVDAAMVGIAARGELGKGKAGVGTQKTGIKGTLVSKTAIIRDNRVGLLGTVFPGEWCPHVNG